LAHVPRGQGVSVPSLSRAARPVGARECLACSSRWHRASQRGAIPRHSTTFSCRRSLWPDMSGFCPDSNPAIEEVRSCTTMVASGRQCPDSVRIRYDRLSFQH